VAVVILVSPCLAFFEQSYHTAATIEQNVGNNRDIIVLSPITSVPAIDRDAMSGLGPKVKSAEPVGTSAFGQTLTRFAQIDFFRFRPNGLCLGF